MKQKSRHPKAGALAALALSLSISQVLAQAYPAKPVRIYTSAPAGPYDIVLRGISPSLQHGIGQPIVIENRGGGPITAADAMQKAAPDGYTLLFYGNSLWTLPLMRTGLNYDMNRDYAPISMAMGVPIELLGILVAVEAVPDIFRTVGNVSGDMAATVIVGKGQISPEAAAPASQRG